jgi:1-acyl-sn-glycerol-3-phosphate acyltransferase
MRLGHPPFSLRLYRLFRAPVRGLLRLWFGVSVHGLERVPASGGLVVAANHASYADPVLLAAFAPRPLRFMMLRSFWDLPVVGFFCSLFGAFPVSDGRITPETVRRCREVLGGGEVLGIFPEGGRSQDGRLRKPRPGAVVMAMAAGVPIVPVTINGIFEAWPPSRRLPRPGRVTIVFGEPFTEHLACACPDDKERLAALTDSLMASIGANLDG